MTMLKSQTTLMLILIKLFLISAFIFFITGCTSMSSVMPRQSLTMEKIYDESGKLKTAEDGNGNNNTSSTDEDNLKHLRKEVINTPSFSTSLAENVSADHTWQSFHKVPNPTLKLYVYPHLAGNDELPVPGYITAFNAYDKDHYSLPKDYAF